MVDKIKVTNKKAIKDLKSMKAHLQNTINAIDRLLPRLEVIVVPPNIKNITHRPSCPYCKSYNLRMSSKGGFCLRCGKRSELIGSELFEIQEEELFE